MSETLLKLRSKNFKSVKITAPTGGLTAGQLCASNSLVGVVVETVAAGKETALIYACDKIVVPKRAGTGITFSIGTKVYYRSAGPDVTNASTSNTLIGRATETADAADTEVEIDLMGNVVA
jgi:predicted RecA/RadA family phage recombinase